MLDAAERTHMRRGQRELTHAAGSSVQGQGGAPPGDVCLDTPSAPECADYRYPTERAEQDLDALCSAMPDMPGCSVRGACQVPAVEGVGAGVRACTFTCGCAAAALLLLSMLAHLLRRLRLRMPCVSAVNTAADVDVLAAAAAQLG